ncbi:MAG: pilus assembly protein PilM, partial [Bdellovibrio sp.]
VGSGAEVLACASPKVHVQACLQKAQDAGIEPALISSEGTAFANVYEKWNQPPPALAAMPLELEDSETKPVRHVNLVLNMGHTRTLVCAFEGSSLIAVRSILWGGKNIAEAIAKKYEIPFLEAMKELQTKAFILTSKQGATFDQITFSDTIAKSVRELARDVQLSILEVKSEFNAQIHSIGVTGGVSLMHNLGPFLTQILEAPVNRVSSLEQMPNVLFERSQQTGARIGVALGLAIEGLKKPRNPAINFMRGEFAKDNHQLKVLWEKWGSTIKVGATAVLVLFLYTHLRDSFALGLSERTQEALKEQARIVAGLKGRNASENGIRKYIRENKKRASDLKTLASVVNMNSALDILKKINDATPSKGTVAIDIQQLNIEEATVSLQGYVGSAQELTLLQQALSNITTDGQVKAQRSTLKPLGGKVPFSFSFNTDRDIQKVTR